MLKKLRDLMNSKIPDRKTFWLLAAAGIVFIFVATGIAGTLFQGCVADLSEAVNA